MHTEPGAHVPPSERAGEPCEVPPAHLEGPNAAGTPARFPRAPTHPMALRNPTNSCAGKGPKNGWSGKTLGGGRPADPTTPGRPGDAGTPRDAGETSLLEVLVARSVRRRPATRGAAPELDTEAAAGSSSSGLTQPRPRPWVETLGGADPPPGATPAIHQPAALGGRRPAALGCKHRRGAELRGDLTSFRRPAAAQIHVVAMSGVERPAARWPSGGPVDSVVVVRRGLVLGEGDAGGGSSSLAISQTGMPRTVAWRPIGGRSARRPCPDQIYDNPGWSRMEPGSE